MNKLNKVFMAFASGQESKDSGVAKRYIGIAPVFVLAVNPNKAELEKIYDTTIENDPNYLGESEVGPEDQKRKVKQVRLDFIVKTQAERSNGIEMTSKISFFLKEFHRFNKDMTKVQVIDKYGRTAWASVDDVEQKRIPMYSSGPANIDADYRPAYIGEEELTDFIKQYLNIPNPQNYIDGSWVYKPAEQLGDSLARFDNLGKLFKGDYSGLKAIVKLQPNNRVKALFGVKTTDDNKVYQDVYIQKFLKSGMTDYSRLKKEVEDRKANGAYPNTEFAFGDLCEYSLNATDFSAGNTTTESQEAVNPFSGLPFNA